MRVTRSPGCHCGGASSCSTTASPSGRETGCCRAVSAGNCCRAQTPAKVWRCPPRSSHGEVKGESGKERDMAVECEIQVGTGWRWHHHSVPTQRPSASLPAEVYGSGSEDRVSTQARTGKNPESESTVRHQTGEPTRLQTIVGTEAGPVGRRDASIVLEGLHLDPLQPITRLQTGTS
jgi:hypothetical protein